MFLQLYGKNKTWGISIVNLGLPRLSAVTDPTKCVSAQTALDGEEPIKCLNKKIYGTFSFLGLDQNLYVKLAYLYFVLCFKNKYYFPSGNRRE